MNASQLLLPVNYLSDLEVLIPPEQTYHPDFNHINPLQRLHFRLLALEYFSLAFSNLLVLHLYPLHQFLCLAEGSISLAKVLAF